MLATIWREFKPYAFIIVFFFGLFIGLVGCLTANSDVQKCREILHPSKGGV